MYCARGLGQSGEQDIRSLPSWSLQSRGEEKSKHKKYFKNALRATNETNQSIDKEYNRGREALT